MHSFQVVAVASVLMTTTSALPRFPFAALFERTPQYEAISSFPTLTVAGATGVEPSGILTGSGTFGAFPTATGTGLPFFPNKTFTGVPSESLASFSIATSLSVGAIKVPIGTSLSVSSIYPALSGAASCPVATPETVTATVTETVTQGGAPFPSGTGGATGTVGSAILPTVTPFAL